MTGNLNAVKFHHFTLVPISIGKQRGDGGHGGPLAVKGNSHVVNHAIKLKMVANFLHGFAELAAVISRGHAQAGVGFTHDGGCLLKHARRTEPEPVEGIAKAVCAVVYGVVFGTQGREPLDDFGVAVNCLLHMFSAGMIR